MNTNTVKVSNEQVNDVPLIVGLLEDMGVRRHVDKQVVQHASWEGISAGTLLEIWLCYILTEQDHRLVAVREWANDRREMFNQLLGIELRDTDLSDDRLAVVLDKIGYEKIQGQIDREMIREWVNVYALPSETIRLDSTSVTVYSALESKKYGLIQRGHSKDHRPDLGQFKIMLSTLDPLGMPLVCQVVSGQQADDGLYVPSYDKTIRLLGRSDVLVVGDSKMAAVDTRGHIVAGGSRYLCAYRPVGRNTALADWVKAAFEHEADWETVSDVDKTTGEMHAVAVIYNGQRSQTWLDPHSQLPHDWSERVLVVRSESMREKLLQHSRERLSQFEQALAVLRRPIGRGRRRYHTQADLKPVVQALFVKYHLTGLGTVPFLEEILPNGDSRWIVGQFKLDAEQWAIYQRQLGWQLYLTNATPAQYDNPALLWTYRHQIFHERTFSRLKTRQLNIRPLFLRRHQRIAGLTWLLCLALRLLTLTEFRIRTALQQQHEAIVGLNPAVPSQAVVRPTTERVLHAFKNITVTTIDFGNSIQRFTSELSPTQCQILRLLALPADLYSRLASLSPTPESSANLYSFVRLKTSGVVP
jgi:transposase